MLMSLNWVITRYPFAVASPAGSSCRSEMLWFSFHVLRLRYLNNGLPQCSPLIVRFGNVFHCRVLDYDCASIVITSLKSCQTTLAHLPPFNPV